MINTRIKKFIVIFSIAMIISLSIPHVSLWNFGFSFGVGVSKAQCYSSATIPGRTRTLHWVNPKEKKDPPRNCVDQYNGDPSSGDIRAKIDHTLVQSGGTLTITGSVAKLCSTCNGWIYTCEAFEEHTCKKTNYIFWDRCSYKDCPADMPNRLHAEGKDTKWKIGRIIGGILIIAALLSGVGGAIGKVLAKIVGSLGGKTTVMVVGAALMASGDGYTTQGYPITYQVKGTAEELAACPDCYSICGKTYETDAGNAPICAKGWGTAEVVIAYKNATYKCPEGYCGMWENKKVKIEIRDPNGNIVKTDTTTTDAYGQFSYTFTAPQADGEFTVIVSVPKD